MRVFRCTAKQTNKSLTSLSISEDRAAARVESQVRGANRVCEQRMMNSSNFKLCLPKEMVSPSEGHGQWEWLC